MRKIIRRLLGIYNTEELVDFGNYLLSRKENGDLVGHWDLENWKEKRKHDS